MAEEIDISVLPQAQKTAKSFPYEALWRSYYDGLSDKEKKSFGEANVLDQTRMISDGLHSDNWKNILNGAFKYTTQHGGSTLINPYNSAGTQVDLKFDERPLTDHLMLRKQAIDDLYDRGKWLSTMTQKALDTQKFKETMGVGNLTDEEFTKWLQNEPLYRAGETNFTLAGDAYSIPKKLDAQAKKNSYLMRTPENFRNKNSANERANALNYLINKEYYYSPENTKERVLDNLGITFSIPYLSQGAIARQQGEIGPDETGLNIRNIAGGTINAAAYPVMGGLKTGASLLRTLGTLGTGGGLIGLGNSIAKGERGETNPFNYLIGDYLYDAGTASGTAAGLGGATSFIPGVISNAVRKLTKNPHPLTKAQSELKSATNAVNAYKNAENYAQEKIDNLEKPFYPNDNAYPRIKSNDEAYTNKINEAIQGGKLSNVDADAFDPTREGDKYVIFPRQIWKNKTAIDEQANAAEAELGRNKALKKYNAESGNILSDDGKWLIPTKDEGGYNPTIEKARELTGTSGPAEVEWNNPEYWDYMASNEPPTTLQMIADKPLYPFRDNNHPMTLSQSIFKSMGYDKAGKGAQKGSGTNAQYEKTKEIMSQLPENLQKFIRSNYNDNPLNFARAVVDESDKLVQRAYDLHRNGELDGNTLKSLIDEYISWNTSSGDRTSNNRLAQEFLSKLNATKNAKRFNKEWDYNPRGTTIPGYLNAGKDMKTFLQDKGFLNEGNKPRPNPTLAAIGHRVNPDDMLNDLARSIHEYNTGKRILNNTSPEMDAITPEEWSTALAYYGDLEVPSNSAISANISSGDRAKIKQVKEAFDNFLNEHNIPKESDVLKSEIRKRNISDKAKQAESKKEDIEKIIRSLKNNEGKVDLFRKEDYKGPHKGINKVLFPFYPIGRLFESRMIKPGTLVGAGYGTQLNALSEPEKETREDIIRSNPANWSAITKKVPGIIPYKFNYGSKKRGNYVPEFNLRYTIPDDAKERKSDDTKEKK